MMQLTNIYIDMVVCVFCIA